MDLWIRSQKKDKLIKVDNLIYGAYDDSYCIYTTGTILGEYTTKEQCKKILDQIADLFDDARGFESVVYEMPKDKGANND